MGRICVIDDQALLRESLTAALQREDHEVTAFADPVEALQRVAAGAFDAVVTDLKMPRLDGVGLLRELRAGGSEVPVVLMTAYGTVDTAVEAMNLGAYDYIQKPFEADEICLLVDRAIQHGRLQRQNEALRRSLADWHESHRLIGRSEAIAHVRRQIEQVAASHATVLVTGESGTGKELVARAVHAAGPRASQAMLCLNCAALSGELLASELFGHERGAFTGADRTRKGRFELADGGTLLLDEISEISMSLQAKLLRVLQERQFERVGSSVTRTVDVRVIATTNRNLREWIAAKRFRDDLYFRLSVLPIHLPPLRDRREDIELLVDYFAERLGRREGRRRLRFSREAVDLLRQYDWPGNVRELENVCERACVLADASTVTAEMIAPWLAGVGRQAEHKLGPLRPGHLIEDAERDLIEQMLAKFNGHRQRTAEALGIGVRTLTLKLKKYRQEVRRAG